MLDDRHATAEAAISLRHFDTDVAPTQHDQMRRRIVEIQCANVGKRLRITKTGTVRNRRVRSDVDDDLVAAQRACSAVVQLHFDRFQRNETPAAHDQLRTARRVRLQMKRDLAFDHAALALAHFRHVRRDGARHRAEIGGALRQMRDARAPDFVLAGQTRNGRARAAHPLTLDDGNPLARSPQVPR